LRDRDHWRVSKLLQPLSRVRRAYDVKTTMFPGILCALGRSLTTDLLYPTGYRHRLAHASQALEQLSFRISRAPTAVIDVSVCKAGTVIVFISPQLHVSRVEQ